MSHRPKDLNELQLWAISHRSCIWMIDVTAYEACRVAGVIDRVLIDPRRGCIDVVVTDGTHAISATWIIDTASPRPALVPGTGVIVEGVPFPAPDGTWEMHDPSLEVTPFPAVA